jgi:monovalent cation/proton antiporter MnhG/PhaG subunit
MNVRELIVVILLALGIGIQWISSIGLIAMRTPYDRLHAAGPGGLLMPVFVTAAVLVHGGFSAMGIKAILIMLVAIFTSPVVTHAIGRAARIREAGALKSAK